MILNTYLTLYPADKQCSWQYALHFGLMQFPGRVENAQSVNFLKFRTVTISQVGDIGVIICGSYTLHSADKQSISLYAVHFMFLSFPDGVEDAQNVNFLKFRNVTISQIEYIVVIICGECMLHSADKQSISLYAVHFMFLSFPDGVENAQNVNFLKFRNVTILQIEYIVVIICGSCMLHSADKQSSLLCAVHFMFLTVPDKIKIVQNEMSIFRFFFGWLVWVID